MPGYGTAGDFELAREGDCWVRYPTRPAWTAAGELRMVLRDRSTWEAVYEQMAEGVAVQEKLQSIGDFGCFSGEVYRLINKHLGTLALLFSGPFGQRCIIWLLS